MAKYFSVHQDEWRDSDTRKRIESSIDDFVRNTDTVVKPAEGSGGYGIKIFKSGDREGVLRHIEKLAKWGHAVVESRLFTPQVSLSGENLDWNLRVFMVREPTGKLEMMGILVRVGDTIVNVAGGAFVLDYKWALSHLEGFNFSEKEIAQIIERLAETAKSAIRACEQYGKKLCTSYYPKVYPKEWLEAFTEELAFGPDFLAVDFLFDKRIKKFFVGEVQAAYGSQWWASKLGIDIVTPTIIIAKERGKRHMTNIYEKKG